MKKDLVVINDVGITAEVTEGSIKHNVLHVKQQLETILDRFIDKTYEPEESEAKKHSKTLRKLKKTLQQQRLKIRRKLLAPYKEFYDIGIDLERMIDPAIKRMDRYGKGFETTKWDVFNDYEFRIRCNKKELHKLIVYLSTHGIDHNYEEVKWIKEEII
jgi:hypothetical protein